MWCSVYIRDNLSYLDRNDLVPDRLEMLCAEITRPFSKIHSQSLRGCLHDPALPGCNKAREHFNVLK